MNVPYTFLEKLNLSRHPGREYRVRWRSALHIRTHLHDTRLTMEGEQENVDQAVKIVEEYNHLTRHGRDAFQRRSEIADARGHG